MPEKLSFYLINRDLRPHTVSKELLGKIECWKRRVWIFQRPLVRKTGAPSASPSTGSSSKLARDRF